MKDTTILMVEDHKELRESLEESLSFTTNVIAVSNGIDCLEMLKKEIPDLILLDIMPTRFFTFSNNSLILSGFTK